VAGKVILFGVVAVFVAWLAVPQLRDGSFKLIRPSEPVTVVLRGESQSSLKPGIEPDEQVLALSINGESRAYSVPLLSRHEIVNDVVGGVPVAVTW
jgi:hypothetical protein